MPLGACNTSLVSTVLIGRQEREGSEGIGKKKKKKCTHAYWHSLGSRRVHQMFRANVQGCPQLESLQRQLAG